MTDYERLLKKYDNDYVSKRVFKDLLDVIELEEE